MKKYTLYIGIIAAILFFSADVGFSQTVDKDRANKETKTLEQILEEEKAQKHQKIDDFLDAFDKGYDKSTGEQLGDLLTDDAGIQPDDENITTDSFEEFNTAFDKMIEEDLADFNLVAIEPDDLEADLVDHGAMNE